LNCWKCFLDIQFLNYFLKTSKQTTREGHVGIGIKIYNFLRQKKFSEEKIIRFSDWVA
jgi:hypothetical protein